MTRSLTLLVMLAHAGILGAYGSPSPAIEAAPAVQSSYCANFDNLPRNPTGFDTRVNFVGTYKGIEYQGFYVATPKNDPADSNVFAVPSKPNVAIGPYQDFLGQYRLLLNTAATGGSPSDSFDITSLRFLCVLTNGPNVLGGLNNCSVTFVGNKRSGAKSVVYEYEYTAPPDGGSSPPQLDTIKFPKGFTGLSDLFLNIVAQGQGGPSPVLDNVCVNIRSK